MSFHRRRFITALGALPLASALPVWAVDEQLDIARKRGKLRVAVYEDFAPYSLAGKGIDVDLGKALAERMGLQAEIVSFPAREEMKDDLRIMVWGGHYLRGEPADVMLHVPLDPILAKQNPKVKIFGQYHIETMAVARDASRVPVPRGSAAISLEVFTREKIGVESASLADQFLMEVLRGRLRDNVMHYKTIKEAAANLVDGKISAVLATRTELEAALAGNTRFPIEFAEYGELTIRKWPLGMAVRAEATDLEVELNKALDSLRADGSLAKIFKSHGSALNTGA